MANNFLKALRKHFEPLRSFPDLGASRDYMKSGLRVVFHKRYAIYYQSLPNVLYIVRVVHSARDIENIFGDAEPDSGQP